MSRAQWLAFGPLALAGCNAHVEATNDADTIAMTVDASAVDATADDAAEEGQQTAERAADDVAATEATTYQAAVLDAAADAVPDGCAVAPGVGLCCNLPVWGPCCDPRTQYYYSYANANFGGCFNFDFTPAGDAGLVPGHIDAGNCAASHTCACLQKLGGCSGVCSEHVPDRSMPGPSTGDNLVTCYIPSLLRSTARSP